MTLARNVAPRHLQIPGVAIASGGRSGQSRVLLELQQRPSNQAISCLRQSVQRRVPTVARERKGDAARRST
jgi:hypothetical protein